MITFLAIYIPITLVLSFIMYRSFVVPTYSWEEEEHRNDPIKYHIKKVTESLLCAAITPVALIMLAIAFFDWFDDINLTKLLAKKQAPKELDDSIEVINFRDLSGQELDAELTRLHKEKNGWN